MNWTCVLALLISLQLHLTPCSEAAFTVSLELQGGNCSDQLTLICRHSDAFTDPRWIHNRTVENGDTLATAFSGAMYTVQNRTEHTTTITGIDSVRALDGHLIQCAYNVLGNLIKSNAVKYSFTPSDYQPALFMVSFTADFSQRLCTFTYSFQESCGLYPRCTPYFSVEHTVSPQSVVSNTSDGCSVEYTIDNLMRCVSYQSTAIALLSNQRGSTVIVGDTVMQSPGRFNITSVSIGADNDLINVTYMEYEPDCPGYPTEWYTVDVDGVQVANMTADEFQSRVTNHTNGSLTLSLTLTQRLSKSAVTMNMTRFNTVPTNRSDNMGNIVNEMVTWGTSAVFDLQVSSPPGGETPAAATGEVVIAASASVAVIVVIVVVAVVVVICVFCTRRNRKRKVFSCGCHNPMAAVSSRGEGPAGNSPGSYDETPTDDHGWVKGAGRRLPLPPKEEEQGTVMPEEEEKGSVPHEGKTEGRGIHTRAAAQSGQQYVQVDFATKVSNPVPPSDLFVVQYAEVGEA